jgi:hypothetical protein
MTFTSHSTRCYFINSSLQTLRAIKLQRQIIVNWINKTTLQYNLNLTKDNIMQCVVGKCVSDSICQLYVTTQTPYEMSTLTLKEQLGKQSSTITKYAPRIQTGCINGNVNNIKELQPII